MASQQDTQSRKINVLNAGYVELLDFMGGDEAILRGARICFQTEGATEEANNNLLKMLVRERHTSPMEHCVATFRVKAPIFVFRQWHRHRVGMSYNELSLRYCEAKPEFFIPMEDKFKAVYYCDMDSAYRNYETYLDMYIKDGYSQGRARELARPHLPLGLYSEMIWTANAASIMHFIDLRADGHAQKEMQLYANAVLYLSKLVAPRTFNYKAELLAELSSKK